MHVKRSIALLAFLATALAAHAQDGSYDSTFGDSGRTWIDVTPNVDSAYRMIRLPNGNFFMGGGCYNVACAAWLTPYGTLATGYGTSGTGTVAFSSFAGWPSDAYEILDAVALPDGRVAVVVEQNSDAGAYIALLRADGTGLDASVGNGAGYVHPAFNTTLLRFTAQQQLLAVGASNDTTSAIEVARFNANFSLDTSFGSNGVASIAFASGGAYPAGMTVQKDGKIVVIGDVGGSPSSLGIVRFTANGAADTTFGINFDGRYTNAFSVYGASGNDIVQDKKGRLVFAGQVRTDNSASSEWLVGRLLGGGAVDSAFNGGAAREFVIAGSSTGYGPSACCVALQSDNRIVVAGTMDRPAKDPAEYYFAITRFNDDGSFDTSFGGSGESYGDMSPEGTSVYTDSPHSMIVVPGGIVVGGYTQTTSDTRFTATKEKIDLLFADDFE